MTTLSFTPDRNAPGKNDFTGAFWPEAKKFAKLHPGRVVKISTPVQALKGPQRVVILDEIAAEPGPLDCVAFFCHGFTKALQLGFDRITVGELAKAVAARQCSRIALYACSAGDGPGVDGDGGFADNLRDAMLDAGLTDVRVVAHVTAGHATSNPHVRFFEENSRLGGFRPIEMKTAEWKKWQKALRTDFRFDLPWATPESIAEIVK